MPAIRTDEHKPHACLANNCTSSFKRMTDLARHMLKHTGEKRHICTVCKKAFAQSSNLRTHENIHEGKRPHACNIGGCTATFGDPSSRTRHRREKHGDRTYECSFVGCGSRIKRRKTFVEHLQKKHGVDDKSFNVGACYVYMSQTETPGSHSASFMQASSRAYALTPDSGSSSGYLAPAPLTPASSASGSVSPLSLGPSPLSSGTVSPLSSSPTPTPPSEQWQPRYPEFSSLSAGIPSSSSVSRLAPPVSQERGSIPDSEFWAPIPYFPGPGESEPACVLKRHLAKESVQRVGTTTRGYCPTPGHRLGTP
ncbi:hypothetical protein B0H21DRAFT_734118 [Amylocystis lapponica]|nr:hypothetical protein B0H21DRAFT_734118 [Amylocystis lapponica]